MPGSTDYYERPYEIVKDQIDSMSGRADTALTQAQQAIAALENIPSPTQGILPPLFALPADVEDTLPDPKIPVRPDYFPAASIAIPARIDPNTLISDLEDPSEIPGYTPPAITLNIPGVPDPIDLSGLPSVPIVEDVVLPDEPTITEPELGNILQIVIPTFEGLNLPVFSATAPVFTAIVPPGLAWGEPVYTSTTLDTLKARVATMLGGGTGLTPAIEQALFDRAIARTDSDADTKEDEAFNTWAARG
jgi:hypothetical protein